MEAISMLAYLVVLILLGVGIGCWAFPYKHSESFFASYARWMVGWYAIGIIIFFIFVTITAIVKVLGG